MSWLKISWIIAALTFGCIASLAAQMTTYSTDNSPNWLNRDLTTEQDIKYLAGPDTSITPARVLHWMSSLMGHPILNGPTTTEFEPVFYADNSNMRIVARIAFKF
jgi:hypothetical protein